MKKIDPYLDRRLKAEGNISFLEFIDTLQELWQKAGKKGKFIRDEPIKEGMELPVITFRTLRRIIDHNFKDHKPRYRQTIRHPYKPDEFIDILGQVFQVWVEFSVLSTSAEEADEMVEDLIDFIELYKGYFRLHGVKDIRFYAQLSDKVLKDHNIPIACRTLQYTMWFEKLIPVILNQIDHLAVQAGIIAQDYIDEEEYPDGNFTGQI